LVEGKRGKSGGSAGYLKPEEFKERKGAGKGISL